ncbi:MAG: hypothetical protein HOM15_02910 [Gammaproteobacteria bacterium]|jgi:hypothetical protein|nr:hypothetical protein [Gammaproteobacteria bacterium]
MTEYDSSCIKIKEFATDTRSMGASLAEEFNGNEKLIQRGLVACELAGVHHSYYVDKYLRKLDIPINQDVSTIYAEQLKLGKQ